MSSINLLLILYIVSVCRSVTITTTDGTFGIDFDAQGVMTNSVIDGAAYPGGGAYDYTAYGEPMEFGTTNYLINGDFETIRPDNDTLAASWSSYSVGYRRSTEFAHSGSYSIKTVSTSATMRTGARQSVQFPVDNQIMYLHVSGWSKAVSVASTTDLGDYSLYTDINFWDNSSQHGEVAVFTPGTHDWEYSERLITLNGAVKSVSVYCMLRDRTGTAYFDDVVMRTYTVPSFSMQPVSIFGNVVTQSGSSPSLGLSVSYTAHQHHIRTSLTVTNTNVMLSNRFIAVTCWVPLNVSDAWTWHTTPLQHVPMTSSFVGSSSNFKVTNTISSSYYPIVAASSSSAGVGLSVPVDGPMVSYRFRYSGVRVGLGVEFIFAITDVITDPGLDNKVSVSFDVFALGVPEWGFRSALERHVQDIHPDIYLQRVVREQGIWMAFFKISEIQGWEDFGFKFHEESREEAWDNEHGIMVFPYVEPTMAHIDTFTFTPPFNTTDLTAFVADCSINDATDMRYECLIAENSGARDRNGILLATTEGSTWGARVPVVSNSMPVPAYPSNYTKNIELLNQINDDYVDANVDNYTVDGLYLDSLESFGSTVNEKVSLISTITSPAMFTDDYKVMTVVAQHSYQFGRSAAELIRNKGGSVMSNAVYVKWPYFTSIVDVAGMYVDVLIFMPGIEISWLRDGKHTPWDMEDLARQRALSYRKPYLFLENSDYTVWTASNTRYYMDICMMYGLFPSFFDALGQGEYYYFKHPEYYNRDRPYFKYYIPRIQEINYDGWQPITHASAENGYIERWGNATFTLRGNGTDGVTSKIAVTFDTSALLMPDAKYTIVLDTHAGTSRVYCSAMTGVMHCQLPLRGGYTAVVKIINYVEPGASSASMLNVWLCMMILMALLM